MDERKRQAIERTAGSLTGAFPPGYLNKLRGEWDRPWDTSLIGERNGRPCVAGTDIYVEQVLATVAESDCSTAAELLGLSEGQVLACVRFARQQNSWAGTRRAGARTDDREGA